MKSVLRCQNKPKSVGFSIIGLLIDRKKSKAACGPLKRPEQAFSWLSISQCFDFQSRKAADVGKRGDVIRWSVLDLPPRFALNSLFALHFLCQDRGYSSFQALLSFLVRYYNNRLKSQGFVTAICQTLPNCISRTIYDAAGNPIFHIIFLCFGISLLFVVYRVIKRAITKV